MRLYLAGPDVFLPDPLARGAVLKAACAARGLVGVFPLDPLAGGDLPEWADLPEPLRIARRNETHIAACDALLANLTPFRGPSADVGTVYELGYARALGRPVFGWSNDARRFTQRTRNFCKVSGNIDADGLQIEDFGLADNLMVDGAIAASSGAFIRQSCRPAEIWHDLRAFEACLDAVAEAKEKRAP
jgi:nucleoside 2-deoxyribosyltransferase